MTDELQFRADPTQLQTAVAAMVKSLQGFQQMQDRLARAASESKKLETARANAMAAASKQIISNNRILQAHAEKAARVAEATSKSQIANQRRLQAMHNKTAEVAVAAARKEEASARKVVARSEERTAKLRHEIDLLRQRQAIPLQRMAGQQAAERAQSSRLLAQERRKLEILKQQHRERNMLLRQQMGMRQETQKLLISWQSIGRILAIRIGYQAFTAFVNQIREGVRASLEFQQAVAGVQTISQRAGMTTQEWADGLQRVSDGWRLDVIEQAEAAYQALTNQVVHGREAFEFLESANRFATAAITETNQAVRLAASVLNAYNMDISRTEEVYRSFFKTIELGRLRAGDLTEIGRVLLPGAQLGIEYQEVSAAMATLTRQGAKATEAMTFLRGIFQRLIRPTDRMKEFFDELGVSSGEAAIQTFGYIGFLRKLEERFKGSSEEIGELFSRIRAIIGVFGQQGSALQDLERDYNEIINAQDNYNNAVEIMQKTSAQQFEIASSRIRNIMIRTGSDIVDTIAGMTDGFQSLVPVVREAVRMFKYGLVPILSVATVAVVKLGYALMSTPPGAAIAAITAVVAAYSWLRGSAERAELAVRQSMDVAEQDMRERLRKETDTAQRLQSQAERIRREERQASLSALAAVLGKASTVLDTQVRASEQALDSILKIGEATNDALSESIRSLEEGIRGADDTARQAIQGILDLWSEQDRTLFDWELEGREGQAAIDFISRRIETLQRQASEAAQRGDLGILDTLQQEARQLLGNRRQLEQRIRQENERGRQQQQQLLQRDEQQRRQYLEQRLSLTQRVRDAENDRERIAAQKELTKLDEDRRQAVVESRNEYGRIEIHQLRAISHEQELIDLVKAQVAQREELASVAEESATKQREELVRQQALQAELGQITEGIRAFRVSDVLALEDPALIDSQLRAQEARIKRLAELAQEAGTPIAEDRIRFDFEQQTMLIRAQQLREEVRLRQQSLQTQLEQLDASRKEAKARRSDLQNYFNLLRRRSAGLGPAIQDALSFHEQRLEFLGRNTSRVDPISHAGIFGEAIQANEDSIAQLRSLQAAVQSIQKGDPVSQQDQAAIIRAASSLEINFNDPNLLAPGGAAAIVQAVQELSGLLVDQTDAEGRRVAAASLSEELIRITESLKEMDEQTIATNKALDENYQSTGETGIDVLESLRERTRLLKEETNSLDGALQRYEETLNRIREQQDTGPRFQPPASSSQSQSTSGSTTVGKVEVNVQAGPTGKIDSRQIVEAVRTATRQGMLA